MALMQFNFRSACLRRATNVSIVLPTNTDRMGSAANLRADARYQVLWLLHGGLGDDRDFLNFSNILRHAEEHHIAVVMPSCEGLFYQEPYFTYVTEELPRLLQKLLPLSHKREDNFIGGLSHGGDCALRACLEKPEQYAAGLVMSAAGTTHFADRENHLLYDVFGLAEKALEGQPTPVIFATGSGDRGAPCYYPVIDRLDEMGYPLRRHYVENDGHSWPFWDNTLKLALDELLPLAHDYV